MANDILREFEKQPNEIKKYDIHFEDWLTDVGDTGSSHTVAVSPSGLTVDSSSLISGVVQVKLSGGTDGVKYQVTARVTSSSGLVEEADITVKVKEV